MTDTAVSISPSAVLFRVYAASPADTRTRDAVRRFYVADDPRGHGRRTGAPLPVLQKREGEHALFWLSLVTLADCSTNRIRRRAIGTASARDSFGVGAGRGASMTTS